MIRSYVTRMGDGKLAKSRCPESGGAKEVRKNEIAMVGLR